MSLERTQTVPDIRMDQTSDPFNIYFPILLFIVIGTARAAYVYQYSSPIPPKGKPSRNNVLTMEVLAILIWSMVIFMAGKVSAGWSWLASFIGLIALLFMYKKYGGN